MKLRILALAVGDIEAGRDFYERQQAGLGQYFLDTLFSDIEALLLHAGVHVRRFGYFRALSQAVSLCDLLQDQWRGHEIWRVLDCRQNPRRTSAALQT